MNRNLELVTFTGVDVRTPREAIDRLLADERVELGVLYTATPEGRNRYPHMDHIETLISWMKGRAALHVCGGEARRRLLAQTIPAVVGVRRIQVNGSLTVEEVEVLCARYPEHTIITQHRSGAGALLSVRARNHALLVDGSGGTGRLPAEWVRPNTSKAVGFAGGLGPDTVGAALPAIQSVARGQWWIDMEGQIRTDDWFDAAKALRVLEMIGTLAANTRLA